VSLHRPAIIAHRGAAAEAPENTLRAFDLGLELGADALELDVRRSLDGELVVIHDATLDRTTSSRGPVVSRRAAELATVDARFGTREGRPPPDRAEPIPLLRDVFVRYVDIEITVDVKDSAAVGDVVRLIEEYDRVDRTILYVEEGTSLPAFTGYGGRRATSTRQALWLAVVGRWLPRRGGDTFPEVIHTPMRTYGVPIVSAGLVRAAHKADRSVQVWTVDDPATMILLAGWGVDGIITNDVRGAAELFSGPHGQERGSS
jgi:glycerophosphoryl diester phosphodiesterase